MGVVLLVSDNETTLCDRCLSQLRRYRGDQTDRPLCMVVDRQDELNYLELKNRHPLVNMYFNDVTVGNTYATLVALLSAALDDYENEETFLWVTPKTYFTQPPRIQVASLADWSFMCREYIPKEPATTVSVHNVNSKYPVPYPGYIVFKRRALSDIVTELEEMCDGIDETKITSVSPAHEMVHMVTMAAMRLRLVPDTQSLRNKLGISSGLSTLSRSDYTRLAVLGDKESL